MGIYNTMEITREDCLKEIMLRLYSADDDTLASVLFDLCADNHDSRLYLHNFSIVPDYSGNDWFIKYRN